MSEERIKQLDKLIKIAETQRAVAMFNNQFEQVSNIKKYKNELLAEKEELEKKLLED